MLHFDAGPVVTSNPFCVNAKIFQRHYGQRFSGKNRPLVAVAAHACYLAAMAEMKSAHAAVDETVRTWFHHVQSFR